MQLHRYRNLFGNFNKLDDTTMMICESVYNTTKNIYSNSDYFLHFNESRYRNLYKKWGGLGLFNHKDNDINPLLYGMINYNIEKIDSSLRSAYSVQSSLVINPIEKFGNDKLKNQYLDNLYSGKSIGSFGLTEPNAGSDPSSMTTKASLHKDYYICMQFNYNSEPSSA